MIYVIQSITDFVCDQTFSLQYVNSLQLHSMGKQQMIYFYAEYMTIYMTIIMTIICITKNFVVFILILKWLYYKLCIITHVIVLLCEILFHYDISVIFKSVANDIILFYYYILNCCIFYYCICIAGSNIISIANSIVISSYIANTISVSY